MTLIRLESIRRVYDLGEVKVPVLHGVSLAIERGEMVALMGASGSGKTTLMNIIGCLDRPTSGEYWLDGREVGQLSLAERATLRNRWIGFVFQSFNLLPRTSAVEQVTMPLAYTAAALDEHVSIERAEAILQRVGLGERLDHLPNQLSGGQQQRVAIARALVNRPPLILADEPTGNLDSKTSVEILEMFRQLNRTEGITIVLVTHDAEVASFARRVITIRDGNIESDEHTDSRAQTSAWAPIVDNGVGSGVVNGSGGGVARGVACGVAGAVASGIAGGVDGGVTSGFDGGVGTGTAPSAEQRGR